MSFAENLIELRKYHNYSQEELAEMIGVSRQTMSKYETGESLPDIEKLMHFYEYKNGFKRFSVRQAESKDGDNHELIQLLKVL